MMYYLWYAATPGNDAEPFVFVSSLCVIKCRPSVSRITIFSLLIRLHQGALLFRHWDATMLNPNLGAKPEETKLQLYA